VLDQRKGFGLEFDETVVLSHGTLQTANDRVCFGGVASREVGAKGEAVEVFVVSATAEACSNAVQGEGRVIEVGEGKFGEVGGGVVDGDGQLLAEVIAGVVDPSVATRRHRGERLAVDECERRPQEFGPR
jgi:hypothetical protein